MGFFGWLLDSLVKNDKLDPYSVAGIAFGLKGDKLTDDEMIILGTALGASGAFDDDNTNDVSKE